jgi:DNA-binding NarL/FixJ family response regulator
MSKSMERKKNAETIDKKKQVLMARIADMKRQGYSNTSIAKHLGLTESTVRTMVSDA